MGTEFRELSTRRIDDRLEHVVDLENRINQEQLVLSKMVQRPQQNQYPIQIA